MSYYDELGVGKDASQAEVKKAYRSKAQKLHPDKGDGDKDKFAALQEAYSVLSKPELRAEYDRTGAKEGAHPKPSLDDQARQYVVSAVFTIVNQTRDATQLNLVASLKKYISEDENSAVLGKREAEKAQNKLKYVATQLHSDNGESDFIAAALRHQADKFEERVRAATDYLAKLEIAKELIEHFDYEFTAATVNTNAGWSSTTFTTA